MSRAIPTHVRKGRKSSSIYARIKNGNIYKLNAPVKPKQVAGVIAQIKQAGQIQLKYWTKCGGVA